jgi:glutathione S-transferase
MTDELVFYTHPMSRGRIVRWMLEELGVPYRTEVVDYGPPRQTPAFRALNPMGKVPVISHGGMIVTECAAICAYLADAFPERKLAPSPGSKARGPYYRWLFFAAGPIEAAATDKALGVVVPPEREGMVGYGSLDRVVGTLEHALAARNYIAGDSFTAADVYVGSHLAWGLQFGTLPKKAAFERYLGGLLSRPAALRAKEIDDALVPQHPVPGASG